MDILVVEKAKEQKENLKHLLLSVLFAFLLTFAAERCMKRIFDKKYGIFLCGYYFDLFSRSVGLCKYESSGCSKTGIAAGLYL